MSLTYCTLYQIPTIFSWYIISPTFQPLNFCDTFLTHNLIKWDVPYKQKNLTDVVIKHWVLHQAVEIEKRVWSMTSEYLAVGYWVSDLGPSGVCPSKHDTGRTFLAPYHRLAATNGEEKYRYTDNDKINSWSISNLIVGFASALHWGEATWPVPWAAPWPHFCLSSRKEKSMILFISSIFTFSCRIKCVIL